MPHTQDLTIPREQLRKAVVSHLRKLQKMPETIKSFFHFPKTQYAVAWWHL